ncbi:Crp/Fnr family transcriptional regulator [Geopsychrobacter electrodiphilus]|uniref:Crp/Fnr family transcriptional regulator n=1 Tax=Geopsychrobacter electrodiphilus TaxID=225196 RepID=UPI0003A1956A|nr:cyclic nucleotide-binding domain-containing protein [Geopsychrobacter electrodiphilus]
MSVDFTGLDDSPIFTGFLPAEMTTLSSVFTQKEMGEGKTVFVENMQGESLYLIKHGTIRISKMMAEGDEEVLVVLGPSDVFGEMALFDGAHRSATARVAEAVTLLCLSKTDFEILSAKDSALCLKLALNIIRLFSGRIRSSQAAHRDLLLDALGRSH